MIAQYFCLINEVCYWGVKTKLTTAQRITLLMDWKASNTDSYLTKQRRQEGKKFI